MKRQSKIHFPKLPSKKVKEAEGQKQVAYWVDVKARQPGVTLQVVVVVVVRKLTLASYVVKDMLQLG